MPAHNHFAFLIHPPDLAALDGATGRFGHKQIARIRAAWRSGRPPERPVLLRNDVSFRLENGKRAVGHFVGIPLTASEILRAMAMERHGRGSLRARRLLEESFELARQQGARFVGLGGLLAPLTRTLCPEPEGLCLVPGNDLTIAAAMDLAMRPHESGSTVMGIVGACGEIGSVCASIAAEQGWALRLFGNPRRGRNSLDRLARSAATLRERFAVEVTAHLCGDSVIRECDVVLSATNSSHQVLSVQDFGPNTTVCDLAVPADVSVDVAREDVHVFRGGLVRLPNPYDDPGFDAGLPGQCVYACMAETLLRSALSMKPTGDSVERARSISAEAIVHGMTFVHTHHALGSYCPGEAAAVEPVEGAA